MASKKTTEQTQTPAWSAPPPTQATTNLQGMIDKGGADFSTPIRNQYSRAEAENTRSYNNPLGSFTTADVRDKSQRAENANFHQNLGIDLSNAAQDSANNQFSHQATVAGLTAPQNYMAKSVSKISDPFGNAMQIANLAVSGANGGATASIKGA